MAAGKLTQGAVAPDKKLSQGAWEESKVAAVTSNKATKFGKPAGIMRGMIHHTWHEMDAFRPIGGI